MLWRLATRLAQAAGLLAVLAAALFAVLQTSWAKRVIAEAVERYAHGPGFERVTVQGITGIVPFDMQVSRVAVYDQGAEWLRVEYAIVRWSPRHLLERRVYLRSVTARRVALNALPRTEAEKEPKPWKLPELPRLPKWLTVDSAAVGELTVSEKVLPEAGRFVLAGHYRPQSGSNGVAIGFRLHRIDRATTHADAEITLTGQSLAVDVSASDSAYLPELLDIENTFELRLVGSGPLSDWRGDFRVALGETDICSIRAALAAREDTRVELSGDVTLHEALVPETARARIGTAASIDFRAALSPDGRLQLEEGLVDTTFARLDVSGFTHLEERVFQGTAQFDYDDARRLLGEESDSSPKPVAISARGSGEWTDIHWNLNGRAGDVDFARVQGRAAIDDVIAVELDGRIGVPEFVLPAAYRELSQDRFDVDLAAAFDTQTSQVAVQQFGLDGDWARLEANGSLGFADDRLEAHARAQLRNTNRLNDLFGLGLDGSGIVTADIEGDAAVTRLESRLEVAQVQRDDFRVESGNVSVDASGGPWRGDVLAGLSAKIEGATGHIRFADKTQKPMRLAGRVERIGDDAYTLTDFEITDGAFTVRGQGRATADFQSLSARVQAETDSIKPYTAFANQPYGGRVTAEANAAYSAEGTGWEGSLTAALRDPAEFPEAAMAVLASGANLSTGFRFVDGVLTLQDLEADTPHVRIGGGGSYDTSEQSFRVTAEAEVPNLAVLEDALGQAVQGQALGRLESEGRFDDFIAQLYVDAANPGVGSFSIASLKGDVDASGAIDDLRVNADLRAINNDERVTANGALRYVDGAIDLERLAAINGSNRVDARGTWHLEEGPGDVSLKAVLTDLATIGNFAQMDLAGRLNADAALSAQGGVPVLTVNANGTAIATPYASLQSVDIDGTVNDPIANPRGRLQLAVAEIEQDQARVESFRATATFEEDNVEFDATSDGMLLAAIPFDMAVRGAWNTPERSLSVASFEGHIEEFSIGLIDPARIVFTDSGMRSDDTSLRFGDGRIDLRAAWTDAQLDAEARWSDLPLEALRLAEIPMAEGAVSGNLNLAGALDRPEGTFTLAVRDARSRAMTEYTDLTGNLDVQAVLEPGRIDTDTRLFLSEGSEARIALNLPLLSEDGAPPRIDEDGPWEGSFQSNLDLAVVPQLLVLETHLLTGRFTADVKFDGSPAEPQVKGEARVAAARYENTVTGTILDELVVDIVGDNEQLTLSRFQATDGAGGSIAGEGSASLDASDDFPFAFETRMENARLVHRDDVTGRIDGAVRLDGSMDAASVTGALTVTEANVILRPVPSASIPEIQVVYADAPAPEESAAETDGGRALPDVRLDIPITIPGRAFVLAQDVQTEWQGDVHVGGTVEQPEISGTVQPVRGYIAFLGRRFNLERESTITFDTKNSTSPYLNLTATTRRDNVDATLTMRGTLDEMEIDLRSDPPLPREEILARVLFGRNLSEITPVQAFQLARAVAMFSGKLQGLPFFSGPSRLPVIDTLDIESGEEGAVVSVGKYLADSVFVEFEQGAAQGSSRARVEFEVTPHISLETSVGTNAQGGLGILWKYDY